MNTHTLQLLPFDGYPKLARAAIHHNLSGEPRGNGNRFRRRVGLPVTEPRVGNHGQAMTLGELLHWINYEKNR